MVSAALVFQKKGWWLQPMSDTLRLDRIVKELSNGFRSVCSRADVSVARRSEVEGSRLSPRLGAAIVQPSHPALFAARCADLLAVLQRAVCFQLLMLRANMCVVGVSQGLKFSVAIRKQKQKAIQSYEVDVTVVWRKRWLEALCHQPMAQRATRALFSKGVFHTLASQPNSPNALLPTPSLCVSVLQGPNHSAFVLWFLGDACNHTCTEIDFSRSILRFFPTH